MTEHHSVKTYSENVVAKCESRHFRGDAVVVKSGMDHSIMVFDKDCVPERVHTDDLLEIIASPDGWCGVEADTEQSDTADREVCDECGIEKIGGRCLTRNCDDRHESVDRLLEDDSDD